MRESVEKRSTTRLDFRRSILFEHVATELDQMKSVQRDGISFDISEGGLGMAADYPFTRGEVIKLFLPASKVDTPLPVFAEVVWAHRSEDRFRAGLRFLQ